MSTSLQFFSLGIVPQSATSHWPFFKLSFTFNAIFITFCGGKYQGVAG
jgi:hypothetical protein